MRIWTVSLSQFMLSAVLLTGCMRPFPAGTIREGIGTFDHTGLPSSSCIKCHGTAVPHIPVPADCSRCHEQLRPNQVTLAAPTGTTLGHFAPRDCIDCHLPLTPSTPAFSFSHQQASGKQVNTCSLCHEANRPATTHNAGIDCVNCHVAGAGISWAQSGSPHPANNGALIACVGCHESWRPAQTIYPAPGPTVAGHFATQDCFFCHEPKNPPTITAFVYKHGANGNVNASCLPCHSAKRPTLIVNRFLHNTPASTAGMDDCIHCHNSPGTTWTDGYYNHSAVVSCAACHLTNRPSLTQSYPSVAGVGTFTHGKGNHPNYDCKSCHLSAGVSWVISPISSLCGKCH